jgi:hypothetical protein
MNMPGGDLRRFCEEKLNFQNEPKKGILLPTMQLRCFNLASFFASFAAQQVGRTNWRKRKTPSRFPPCDCPTIAGTKYRDNKFSCHDLIK